MFAEVTGSSLFHHPAKADFCDKALKAFAIGSGSPGLTEVGIDDDDLILLPAKCDRMLPKCILPFCAFDVLKDLTKRDCLM